MTQHAVSDSLLFATLERLAPFGGRKAQMSLDHLWVQLQRGADPRAAMEALLSDLLPEWDDAVRRHLHQALAATEGSLSSVQLELAAALCAVHRRHARPGQRQEASFARLMLKRNGIEVMDRYTDVFRWTSLSCLAGQDDELMPAVLGRLSDHKIDFGPRALSWPGELALLSAVAVGLVLDHYASELRQRLAQPDGADFGSALLRAFCSAEPRKLAGAAQLLRAVTVKELGDREAACYLLATASLYGASGLCATLKEQGGFGNLFAENQPQTMNCYEELDRETLRYLHDHFKPAPLL